MVNDKLLAMLRCPVTGGELTLDADNSRLISEQAQLAYPITDGMPQLLEQAALPLHSTADQE